MLITNPYRKLVSILVSLGIATLETAYLVKKSDKKWDDGEEKDKPKGIFKGFFDFFGDRGDRLGGQIARLARLMPFFAFGNNNGACYNVWMAIRVYDPEDVTRGERQRFTDVQPIVVVQDNEAPLLRRIRAARIILNDDIFDATDRQIARDFLQGVMGGRLIANVTNEIQVRVAQVLLYDMHFAPADQQQAAALYLRDHYERH